LDEVLAKADKTIYVDGNIIPRNNFDDYFNALADGDIGARKHPTRWCVYEEAMEVWRLGYDQQAKIDAAMSEMKFNHFPEKYGLCENGFLVRKMNENNKRLSEIWWDIYQRTSRRDQVTFMYSLWKSGAKLKY
jgi:hypothetical protein